jgi:hypothetical protein
MSKVLKLDVTADVTILAGEPVIDIHVADESLSAWTIGLCMLKEEVLDSVTILSTRAGAKLQLSLAAGASAGHVQSEKRTSVVGVALSRVELERWVHFFLCYLRDGYGSVDHLDVDLEVSSESGPAPGTLVTWAVEHTASAEPRSRKNAEA